MTQPSTPNQVNPWAGQAGQPAQGVGPGQVGQAHQPAQVSPGQAGQPGQPGYGYQADPAWRPTMQVPTAGSAAPAGPAVPTASGGSAHSAASGTHSPYAANGYSGYNAPGYAASAQGAPVQGAPVRNYAAGNNSWGATDAGAVAGAGQPAAQYPWATATPNWSPSPTAPAPAAYSAPSAQVWPTPGAPAVAMGATGAGAPVAARPSKGPAIAIGVGSLMLLLSLALFWYATVVINAREDGFSEIATNGSVEAPLKADKEYGLYYIGQQEPKCTVTDPDKREVDLTKADGRPVTINRYVPFATFTSESTGTYVISCLGQEGDSTWVSPLMTADDEAFSGIWILIGVALIVLSPFPLIVGFVLRARHNREFLRSKTTSLSQRGYM